VRGGERAERRRGAHLYGLKAEQVAAWLLRLKGYTILARRFAVSGGEIDLVARRGGVIGVYARTHLPLVQCAAFLPDAGQALGERAGAPRAATLFLGLEPRLDLPSHGFWPIPDRFRPSPLNLIWRPLADTVPRELDPRAVALNFLDFDPY